MTQQPLPKNWGSDKKITIFRVMNCYITLRKFCSLQKKQKLELKTQNSHAADVSKKIFIGSVVVGSFLQITNKGITMEA